MRCGRVDRRARLEPLDRQFELRVGEAFAGAALARALVVLVVVAPRDVDDAVDLGSHRLERGIVESLAQPPLELRARELDVALALADVARLLGRATRSCHG